VDIIEAGFPIASLAEVEAVERISGEVRGAKIAALARCKPKDIEVAGKALRGAAQPVLHTFLATSAIHLRDKLKITPDQALRQAREVLNKPSTIRHTRLYRTGIMPLPEDSWANCCINSQAISMAGCWLRMQ
jgi:isopropylmalate/homocitrate/citramalate synthase